MVTASQIALATDADSLPVATTLPDEPSDEQVRRMVHRLNHPLLAEREAAVRQLAVWGPRCLPTLYEAAKGASLETALSARDLIAELQAVYLVGAQITLMPSKRRVAWNEPFDLTIHVLNPTPAQIRLPWAAPGDLTTTRPADSDAEQVAAIFDAVEFLVVTGPAGQMLDLRVDPIDRDASVQRVVNERASDHPPSHLLPPGVSTDLHVRAFNRGWARMPMLEGGRYLIRVDYQPDWKNAAWTQARFGRVTSPPVEVVVTQAAPAAIREAQRSTLLRLERHEGQMIATLRNLWDRPIWFNCNLGPDQTLHAQMVWSFSYAGQEDTSQWQSEPSDPRFRLERVLRVDPMEAVEIGREPLDGLRAQTARNGNPRACKVRLHYLNLPTADQIRERLRPDQPDATLPAGLFTGAVASEYVSLDGEGADGGQDTKPSP